MKIEITKVTGPELYRRYPGQCRPQGAYLELDPRDGTVSASYDAEIGNSRPVDVHNGVRLRWRIPALKADAANRLMEWEIPAFERICAGFETRWDGHNTVGVLSEDAGDASAEIESDIEALDGEDHLVVYDAGDYFAPLGNSQAQAKALGITADSDLYEAEDRLLAEAHAEGVDVLENLGSYLDHLQARVKEALAEQEA